MWYAIGPKLAEKAAHRAAENNAGTSTGISKAPKDVQEFLQLLCRQYGTIARAWRMALDTDSIGEVSFRQFMGYLRKHGHSRMRTRFGSTSTHRKATLLVFTHSTLMQLTRWINFAILAQVSMAAWREPFALYLKQTDLPLSARKFSGRNYEL